jgi:hypothetical protein
MSNKSLEIAEKLKKCGGKRTLTKIASIKKLSEIEIRNCLLFFDDEYFVFQLAVQHYKNLNVQNFVFACSFMWVCSWSVTLNEELRLRVFENRVLRKTFGPKMEVIGDWSVWLTLPTKYPGNKINKKEMGGTCGSYGRQKRCTQGFGGDT